MPNVYDQLIVPQSSFATALPLAFNQSFNCAVFPDPSHSTVSSIATILIDGSVVSSIIKSAVVILVFPQSSVAMKSTLTKPVAPQSSLNGASTYDQVTSPQSSVATAPAKDANHPWYSAILPVPSHSTV